MNAQVLFHPRSIGRQTQYCPVRRSWSLDRGWPLAPGSLPFATGLAGVSRRKRHGTVTPFSRREKTGMEGTPQAGRVFQCETSLSHPPSGAKHPHAGRKFEHGEHDPEGSFREQDQSTGIPADSASAGAAGDHERQPGLHLGLARFRYFTDMIL